MTPFWGTSVTFAALLSLAGCSLIPEGSPPQLIHLTAPLKVFPLKERTPVFPAQLVINRPQADHVWDTQRLLLRKPPYFLDHYAGLSWRDRLPVVLQTLLLETFEKTGCFKSVERTPLGAGPSYILRTEIRSFFADYRKGTPPTLDISVKVSLLNPQSRSLLKSALLSTKKQATTDTVEGLGDAFTKATHDILEKIAYWTIFKALEP